jgi:16S rRNA (adenine1518-N6/adenine1519-N6)-dimethyltransferase
VTRAAFGQRRKMLRQSLKSIAPEPGAIIAAAGLDGTVRAEDVPVPGYVRLANAWDASRRPGENHDA